MKNANNPPVEEEEVGLENLTPEEMKIVVVHLASLIQSQLGPKGEN